MCVVTVSGVGMTRGNHIGRVGALAVALGVGVALAGQPGVAWAEDGGSSASSISGSSAGGSLSRDATSRGGVSSRDSADAPNSSIRSRATSGSAEDGSTQESGSRGSRGEARKKPTVGSGREDSRTETSDTSTAAADDDSASDAQSPNAAGAHANGSETTQSSAAVAPPSNSTTSTVDDQGEDSDPAVPVEDPNVPVTHEGTEHVDVEHEPQTPRTDPVAVVSSGSGRDGDRGGSAGEPTTSRKGQAVDQPSVDDSSPIAAERSDALGRTDTIEAGAAPATTVLAAAASPTDGALTPASTRSPNLVEQLLAIPATLFVATVEAVVKAFEPVVGPGGPLENALLWGMLSWTRRQANITFANRSPDIGFDSVSVVVAGDSAGNPIGVLPATDADGDTLTYGVDPNHGPAHGSVSIVGNSVTYTPNAGYIGPDSFTLVASDANNGFRLYALGHGPTDTAIVNIGVNHAPVIDSIVSTPGTGAGRSNTWTLTVTTSDTVGYSATTAVTASNPHLQIIRLSSGQFQIVADEQWAAQNPGDQVTVSVTVTNALGETVDATDIAIGTVNNAIQIGGTNPFAQAPPPALSAGLTYSSVFVGGSYVLVRSDGSSAWFPGLPAGLTIVKVAVGSYPTVFLLSDGTAVATGGPVPPGYPAIPDLPAGMTYTDVAVSNSHTVLLRSDGTVISFGDRHYVHNDIPQPPAGVFYTQVSAGGDDHIVLLRSDGRVVAIGDNTYGQSDVPELPSGMTYTDVIKSGTRTVLMRSDGNVIAFGNNDRGQNDLPELPPGMTYTDVSASDTRTVLLRSDGVAFTTGLNGPEQLPDAPEGTRYTNVGVGTYTIVLLVAKNTDQVQV
jgi:Bacterial Ig domain/Regulator of chromosome condensation (RCC1) repeat